MERQKRWQFYLIVLVLALTLYNILPTLFFYNKPLKAPINEKRAEKISQSIINRVDQLEVDAKEWLYSFCRLLGIKPLSVNSVTSNSALIEVNFRNTKDVLLFKKYLPEAGELISFAPSQLTLYPDLSASSENRAIVQRNTPFNINPVEEKNFFEFTPRFTSDKKRAPLYQKIIYDRAEEIALAIGGPSTIALQIKNVLDVSEGQEKEELFLNIAQEITALENSLEKDSPLLNRYYKSFLQIQETNKQELISQFIIQAENLLKNLMDQRTTIRAEEADARSKGIPSDTLVEQKIILLNNKIQKLEEALFVLKKHKESIAIGNDPLTSEAVQHALAISESNEELQTIDLEGYNPFIKSLTVNWETHEFLFNLYPDVQKARLKETRTEREVQIKEKIELHLFNEISRIARFSQETITPSEDTFVINLDTLPNSESFLVLNLNKLANKRVHQIIDQLLLSWNPAHIDLIRENYPIRSYDDYKASSLIEQKLGLVIYAPTLYPKTPPKGFRTNSIYVIAKGMRALANKYAQNPQSSDNQTMATDFNQLNQLLQPMGFIGYPGDAFDVAKEFSQDYIFELSNYYSSFLDATRENFQVKGSKRYAVLDFSNVEQRILTLNKIEDLMQEDLLKWKEAYNAAQIDINPHSKYTVPAPTKNAYWENLKLSFFKYFRGDNRKVLETGLDISGGKTVRIILVDSNGKTVTNPDDLKQAMNELYTRINKMGVSERKIRLENSTILLDFPGSQNLSASELVKASAMYFHIVNEKFTRKNPQLASAVNQFLQGVWNEAVVTNRKDIESINEIAWKHLGGDLSHPSSMFPRTEQATLLYEQGLRLAMPKESTRDHSFDETFSSIAIFREGDISKWDSPTHPLIIVFHNYALEGSNLEDIQAGYDPNKGNVLSFHVKRSYEGSNEGSPRDSFYTWTSQFAQEKIAGTDKEAITRGSGWRMAIILNGSIITAPSLEAPLKDGGTITGQFSPREITQLVADLKAGSLSFTPRILSEENISPELGKEERTNGIIASITALLLVIIAMIGYYRFAGFIASCAVLLNILILWGVLQNIGAALTLPGIAGIVLTIGMAVDANVLVFERIREEFKLTGRIASSIQAGYKKAFSAIIDSNITTIIAAFILVQFDSGPIKGFAITLIIGIISSMFTALFMTRYFFAGWIRNPQNKSLSMAQLLKDTRFDFLKWAKPAFLISLAIMVIGAYFIVQERKTIFGMDFTGGYSLTVDVEENASQPNYRLAAAHALLEGGASPTDFEIRELSRPTQLRIQLGTSMDERGHPFYQMPEVQDENKYAYEYQKDPRLNWVIDTLQNHGVTISPLELSSVQKNWTIMSGQLSDTMKRNAIIALGIALLSILIYITFRFEFKFAIGAVAGLVHDVLITVGILAFLHALGLSVQIDLQVIGAIMTIIGYSLNDTIIVFDRIREDVKVLKRMSMREIINHALNVTLSRTLMTSGTTILVLIALVTLGGQSLFSFSLVMLIGVVIGTLSSLFIASPVMLYLHERECGLNGNQEASLKRVSS